MNYNLPKYRDPETLTDSEEEIHPNIDAKSYHKFIKEERKRRLEYLENKETLTKEEEKEIIKLKYKLLPVAEEVQEDQLFRVPTETKELDYSEDLIYLLNNNTLDSIIKYLDKKHIILEQFEDLIYYNLVETIKSGDDSLGIELCRIVMYIKWAKEFGRGYLLKLQSTDDQKINEVIEQQYQEYKSTLLSLQL